MTDHLIAWDLPAVPGYREHKAALFELVEPGWAPPTPTPMPSRRPASCTLCGSAQAYLTDSVPPGVEIPVLRYLRAACALEQGHVRPAHRPVPSWPRGWPVGAGQVVVETDGGGLRARRPAGADLPAHESFWFEWTCAEWGHPPSGLPGDRDRPHPRRHHP